MPAGDANLVCTIVAATTVSYASYVNHVAIISSISVENRGPGSLRDCVVSLTMEPALAEPWERRADALEPGTVTEFGPVDLVVSPAELSRATERTPAHLILTVTVGGKPAHQSAHRVDVLAFDEWPGSAMVPDLLAAFVTPNQPYVQELLLAASKRLSAQAGDGSLSGYQSGSRRRVADTVEAIYRALCEAAIGYCVPPASFEVHGQRVRLPDGIRAGRLATCLDVALLAASCLEQAGLHGLVIMVEGHAFCGAWLDERTFGTSTVDDVTLLTNRLEDGSGEIVVFDPTCATQSSGTQLPFTGAVAAARGRLQTASDFQYALDVRKARQAGIRPLPSQGQGAAEREVAEPGPEVGSGVDASGFSVREADRDASGREATRLDAWQRRLLDLTLRNRLLNFRPTKKALRLAVVSPASLEDALADQKELRLAPAPSDWQRTIRSRQLATQRTGVDPVAAQLADELKNGILPLDLDQAAFASAVTAVYRDARTGLEETGSDILYVAIGLLRWFEADQSEQHRSAPLLLVPVRLTRAPNGQTFTLRGADAETVANVTLLEKLRHDFGISTDGLDPLPADESGVHVAEVLARFREAIKDRPRWAVAEEAWLSTFTFGKFLMLQDLRTRQEELKQAPLVASLIRGAMAWRPEADLPQPHDLDRTTAPGQIICPLSADSSQTAAVHAAAGGHTFVLHGPPGTGKSQTITNMVAHALAHQKTVLFVAEKAAALNMVYGRLQKLGLHPFCLELHSSKAGKAAVIEQFREALSYAGGAMPEQWQLRANELATARDRLNGHVEAMHRRRASGLTIHRAIAQLSHLPELRAPIVLDPTAIGAESPEAFSLRRTVAEDLAGAGAACGGPYGHPWRGCRISSCPPGASRTVGARIADVVSALEQAVEATTPVASALGVQGDGLSRQQLNGLAEATTAMLNAGHLPKGLLTATDWTALQAAVKLWVEHGRGHDEVRDALTAGRYTEAVLALDADGLLTDLVAADTKWFVPRWMERRKVAATMRTTVRRGAKLVPAEMEADLQAVARAKREKAAADAQAATVQAILGNAWSEASNDWVAIERASRSGADLRAAATRVAAGDSAVARTLLAHWEDVIRRSAAQPDGELGGMLRALPNALVHLDQVLAVLDASIAMEPQCPVKEATGREWLKRAREALDRWSGNLASLSPWARYVAAAGEATRLGLGPVVAAYEAGELNSDEVAGAARSAQLTSWLEAEVGSDETLRGLSGDGLRLQVARFQQLDDQYADLSTREVLARLAQRAPSGWAAASGNSEMAVLSREIQKQRRHMPLRKLLGQVPSLLARLKPCLLMSPLSVAQFLGPDVPKFDLVIFDEASQVPTCDAVGALGRANAAVVVGDPKQLPPTSFFAGNTDEDEDVVELQQDLESILDDAIGLAIPQMHLQWHYRSRHEGLIAFSNAHYYEGRLYTFPSPDDQHRSVHFHKVAGTYGRSGSKQNPVEAQAVVAELLRQLRRGDVREPSVGVVTFSAAQQRMVEDLLDAAIQDDPELQRYRYSVPEPVFVKNLENVQGDERDVILFSVGYGPDAQGRISVNFGPLNRDGGWRRLNVAISRARREMHVFASFEPEDLDISRTQKQGVGDLRAFMQYARSGKQAIAARASLPGDGEPESPFEAAVAQRLRDQGLVVHGQVGCSGYRIDIGVVHPDHPGRYILGVECDGAMYHSARSARDRDKLREAVLKGLGWNLHRIWSTEWWEDSGRQVDNVVAAVERLRSLSVRETPAPVEVAPAAPPAQAPPPAPQLPLRRSNATPYRTTDLGQFPPYGGIGGYENRALLAKQIRQVVETEAPISRSLLYRRVREAWMVGRLGSQIELVLDSASNAAGLHFTGDGVREFAWADSKAPDALTTYRVCDSDAGRRSSADIAPEEAAAAALAVLAMQGGMPEQELARSAARELGYKRLGKDVEAHMAAGVAILLAKGRAERSSDGRIVPNR